MRRITLACTLGAASLYATVPLPAQGPRIFEAYAARKEDATNPVFGGVSFAGYSGIFGMRLGGGLHFSRSEGKTTEPMNVVYCNADRCWNDVSYETRSFSTVGISRYTADFDVLIAPLRVAPVAKSLLLGFSPYAFVGMGRYGARAGNGVRDFNVTTVSYGAGAHHDLLGWLGVTAEARKRNPIGDGGPVAIGDRKDWEYRFAMTVNYGRHRSPQVITAHLVPSPVASAVTIAPTPEEKAKVRAESLSRRAARVMDAAETQIGVPYRYRGRSPASGFDAPGFVRYVYAKEGIRLSRSVRSMADLGVEVSTQRDSLRPGDLLFFSNEKMRPDHVAIYVGQGRVIHASATGGAVRYDALGEGERGRWFASHLMSARRVLGVRLLSPYPTLEILDESQMVLNEADRAPKPYRAQQ